MKKLGILCIGLLAACVSWANDWTLVSDASALRAGDKVVLAMSAEGMTAGGNEAQKDYLSVVGSTFSEGKEVISLLGAGTVVFTLGGVEGAWTLADEQGNLLSTLSNRKLHIGGEGTTTWTIEIAANGDAVIASTNKACGSIQYNIASPRFWCTTSANKAIQLYRSGADVPKVRLTYKGFPYKRTTCAYPSYYAGSTVTLASGRPQNEEGKVIVGWLYEGTTYAPGGKFTMPETDVELEPVWGEPEQGIETVQKIEHRAQKIMRNGQMIIVLDGVEYTILGGRLQ